MESRTYTIAGKEVKVTNPRIISIVKKAESLESLDKLHEAERELKDYLLGEDCQKYLTIGQFMSNITLWEAIAVQSFDSLTERYVEKFNLSGRLDPIIYLPRRQPEYERNKKNFSERGCR